MKDINTELLEKAGDKRFLSDYHYALFEYYRSPKIFQELDREKIDYSGKILDDGCGSGGIAVSFAEECRLVFGLDICSKFEGTGIKISNERKIKNLKFIQGNGCNLPFKDNYFDLVISHSVIEHTNSPEDYISEAYRVLKPGGIFFLETPPYYSFEGTHLPKPKRPIPFQLFLPRRLLYKIYYFIGKRRPHWFRGGVNGSALFSSTQIQGELPKLENLQKMTIGRLRRLIKKSDFVIMNEKVYYPNGLNKILPEFATAFLSHFPLTRNFIVNTYKLFLQKPSK